MQSFFNHDHLESQTPTISSADLVGDDFTLEATQNQATQMH